MAVLFDATDEYVHTVLDRAKVHGEINLADLEAIIKASKGGQITPDEDDIADTIDALANLGVEIEFLRSIRKRASDARRRSVSILVEITPQLQIPSSKRTSFKTRSPTSGVGSGASTEVSAKTCL